VNTRADDILLIQYLDLGTSPDERLHVLSAIGVLLNRPADFYTSTMLGLHLNEWASLCTWIGKGHGVQFWQFESQGIKISRTCEKHILVGTGQLIADLRSAGEKQLFSRQLLENLWVAAQHYVDSEIIKGSEVTHGR
jgi:hypothetical protein